MNGNEKPSQCDEDTALTAQGRSRNSKGTYSGGLALLVATTAIGLAACGGPSTTTAGAGTSSPTVASLANPGRSDSDGNSTTAPSTGNPTHLLNEWASCMRKHSDPDQADPTIDASKLIHITILPSVPGGLLGPNAQSGQGPVPASYCQAFLLGAINALRGNQEFQPPSQAGLLKYAECMRANGVPDYPDPSGGGLQLHNSPGSDLDPNNPTFVQAGNVCAKKTGVYPPGGGGPLPAENRRVGATRPTGDARPHLLRQRPGGPGWLTCWPDPSNTDVVFVPDSRPSTRKSSTSAANLTTVS